MSTDSDVIMATMRFIPGVVWHAGINTTLSERLYYTVLECFDRSSGRPVVIPKLRNKAYLSVKVLLYLAVQHKRTGDEPDKAAFKSNFSFTVPHHGWMGHTPLYRAWDVLGKGEPLSDDIKEFVLHSLRSEPPLLGRSSPTAYSLLVWSSESSCTLTTCWLLTRVTNAAFKSPGSTEKLTETFSDPTPTTKGIDRALEAMELIAPLSEDETA